MKTVGFPISHKENENRRALIPEDIAKISHPELLYFEKGYGNVLGFCDNDYLKFGVNLVSREEVLKQDVICDPKIGDAEYLGGLKGQTVFGWIHAVQNRDITDKLVNNNLTAYAWEDMFDNGRHTFWHNNELAGEAAIMHAFMCYGKMPYETTVAVIGNGNTARGATKILYMLGATVRQYNKFTEELLRKEISEYDVIVNCVLWDTTREGHIISREELKRMKKGSMIVDVSCDRNGGVETCVPTSFENPTYYEEGVLHYAVDHTPSLFYKTFTKNNSKIICKYIDELLTEDYSECLQNALIIKEGKIIDQRISRFQKR